MLQSFPMYAYLPTKDVAGARRFYEGKLGFRKEHHPSRKPRARHNSSRCCLSISAVPTSRTAQRANGR